MPELTPAEVKAAREKIGMTKPELSRALWLQEDACRAWENGGKRCAGTSALALKLYAALHETPAGRKLLEKVVK